MCEYFAREHDAGTREDGRGKVGSGLGFGCGDERETGG